MTFFGPTTIIMTKAQTWVWYECPFLVCLCVSAQLGPANPSQTISIFAILFPQWIAYGVWTEFSSRIEFEWKALIQRTFVIYIKFFRFFSPNIVIIANKLYITCSCMLFLYKKQKKKYFISFNIHNITLKKFLGRSALLDGAGNCALSLEAQSRCTEITGQTVGRRSCLRKWFWW